MITDLDEKAILVGCCTGERRDQETFIHQYSNLVYNTVLQTYRAKNIAYQSHELDDLHNTVFLRLLDNQCRRLRQYKGKNGCSLASWIRMITVRTVIDHLRQSKDALSQSWKLDDIEGLHRIQAENPDPCQLLDEARQWDLIKQGLDTLTPRDRLFLKLHCLEGAPIQDVAGIMNISENNAYSVKHRAIKRLKAVIEEQLNKK